MGSSTNCAAEIAGADGPSARPGAASSADTVNCPSAIVRVATTFLNAYECGGCPATLMRRNGTEQNVPVKSAATNLSLRTKRLEAEESILASDVMKAEGKRGLTRLCCDTKARASVIDHEFARVEHCPEQVANTFDGSCRGSDVDPGFLEFQPGWRPADSAQEDFLNDPVGIDTGTDRPAQFVNPSGALGLGRIHQFQKFLVVAHVNRLKQGRIARALAVAVHVARG